MTTDLSVASSRGRETHYPPAIKKQARRGDGRGIDDAVSERFCCGPWHSTVRCQRRRAIAKDVVV